MRKIEDAHCICTVVIHQSLQPQRAILHRAHLCRLVQSSSYTITPITYPKTPYDTLRDLAGVTPLALLPQVLVVSPGKGITSMQGLIAAAKANHEKSLKFRTAACEEGPKPKAPTLSDAIKTPSLDTAKNTKTGRGTFDTLTGNPLAK